MPYFKTTIELLVDAKSEAAARADLAGTFYEVLHEIPASSVIDWRYVEMIQEPRPQDWAGVIDDIPNE